MTKLLWTLVGLFALRGITTLVLGVLGMTMAASDVIERLPFVAWTVVSFVFSAVITTAIALAAAKRLHWGVSIAFAGIALLIGLFEMVLNLMMFNGWTDAYPAQEAVFGAVFLLLYNLGGLVGGALTLWPVFRKLAGGRGLD